MGGEKWKLFPTMHDLQKSKNLLLSDKNSQVGDAWNLKEKLLIYCSINRFKFKSSFTELVLLRHIRLVFIAMIEELSLRINCCKILYFSVVQYC